MNGISANNSNVIMFPKSCDLCGRKENIKEAFGLVTCVHCAKCIELTNPSMRAGKDQIEHKAQD